MRAEAIKSKTWYDVRVRCWCVSVACQRAESELVVGPADGVESASRSQPHGVVTGSRVKSPLRGPKLFPHYYSRTMARNPGPIRRLWYSWKMMQLPWRRRWLVGMSRCSESSPAQQSLTGPGFDLEGNTYWEFKDALHSHRNRRIVKYGRRTHYGDVAVPRQYLPANPRTFGLTALSPVDAMAPAHSVRTTHRRRAAV